MSNLKALDSDWYARDYMGRSSKVCRILCDLRRVQFYYQPPRYIYMSYA